MSSRKNIGPHNVNEIKGKCEPKPFGKAFKKFAFLSWKSEDDSKKTKMLNL